jgi:hypothetical protein
MPSKLKQPKTGHRINLLEGQQQRAATAGLPAGWTRRTFIVQEEHLEKLEALSYWDKKSLKQLVDEALSEYLAGKRIKGMR